MNQRRFWRAALIVVLALGIVSVAMNAMAGNRRLMTQKVAEQDMKRNLVEAVTGYKVLSQSATGLTEEATYQIKQKAAALIKGIYIDKMIYDSEKDLAFCIGHVDLGTVRTVFPDVKRYRGVTVYAFGFGTMSADAKPALKALRAAYLDAYTKMAAVIVGEEIQSYSAAQNYILSTDINRSQVAAAVYGAYVPNPNFDDPNRGWGWNKDGDAFIKLHMDLRKAKDIMGNRIRYTGPNPIEVIGWGSQFDELAEEDTSDTPSPSVTGPSWEEKSLNVPVAGEEKAAVPEPSQPLQGGGSYPGDNN